VYEFRVGRSLGGKERRSLQGKRKERGSGRGHVGSVHIGCSGGCLYIIRNV